MNGKKFNRDRIVIGASAGGVEALTQLVRGLPADLPAAVMVVLHVGAASHLAGILDRAGPLPVAQAQRGDLLEQGRVLVAPPNFHMLLHDDHVLLRRGPRENLARPAVDPLFRSAASSFGARVIGVVLSGSLNDGTAGLRAVKRCGGIAVVQDPGDAVVPDMPASALDHVEVDHCVPVSSMSGLLARLAAEPAGETPEIPVEIRLEAAIAAQEVAGMKIEDELGAPSRFSCPECHGALWEIRDGDMLRFRCHVGHAFTADAALKAEDHESEGLLWSLLRSHKERAALARRMAERESRNRALAARLQQRAQEYDEDAAVLQQLLQGERETLDAGLPGQHPDQKPRAHS
jgi:two-component system, chemotaxis family, protein-glutamate methylesterase/glutaminase